MSDKSRIEELEIALVDYIRRYGLTDLARAAMITPAVELSSTPARLARAKDQSGSEVKISAARLR